jgi:hypothetical protein
MDSEALRLECLKIAAEETKSNLLASQKLVERAKELARFVFNEVQAPAVSEDRGAERR